MKKSELRLMIRKIVREEVALSIKEVISEIVKPSKNVSQLKSKPKPKQTYSNNPILNDVLNETAANDEWKAMGGGTYDSSKMGEVLQSSYGDMMSSDSNVQNNNLAASMGVNPNDPSADFLKKDYRKLMKAVDEKAKQKRG
tara:strand:+ start:413 stop:835 length:423 start_codon:yes stop_codon:yes gene_type:complete